MNDQHRGHAAIVVGAGLAGLTAAWRLQQQGWSVKVLEADSRAGGRVLSHQSEDFILDAGPTLITSHYTRYLQLVSEMGLSDCLVDSSPVIGVVSGRELHLLDTRQPLRAFAATRLLSIADKFRLVCKGLKLLPPLWKLNPYDLSNKVHYDKVSMERYLNEVFGSRLNESLLAAVARGVTLSTPEEASVIEFFAGAVAASGKMRNLKGGMEVLPRAMAAKLDVRLNARVTQVQRDGSQVRLCYREDGVDVTEVVDACVLTPRFKDAAELYAPIRDHGAQLLRETVYNGCYSLQLLYNRRSIKEPFIVMVPTSASPVVATMFLEHLKAPDRAPLGQAQITVFFNLKSPFDFAQWSDDRLTTAARDFVEAIFPELCGHFQRSHLTRWPYAAHMGNVGYYRALDDFLTRYPVDEPVQVAGDYMAVSGQESAVIAGEQAAQRLLARASKP